MNQYWMRAIRYSFYAWIRKNLRMPLISRLHLPSFLNLLDLKGTGVEVGVLSGDYTELLLKYSRLSLVIAVDPWKQFHQEEYADGCNADQTVQAQRYEFVRKRLQKFGSRCQIWRKTSAQACLDIGDQELDFVYIDANHSYQACKNDLILWWPKLKPGGVFSGHDYLDDAEKNCGVKSAVDGFVKAYGQKLFIVKESSPSWYLIKKISSSSKATF